MVVVATDRAELPQDSFKDRVTVCLSSAASSSIWRSWSEASGLPKGAQGAIFKSQIVASDALATTSFEDCGVHTTPTQGVGVVGGLGGMGLSGVHPAKGAL